MANVQLKPQQEIPAGARNQAQAYNDNVSAANSNDEQLATELGRQAALPAVRSFNGRSPDANGAITVPITSSSEPMTEAQKLALPPEGLTIGRNIYNLTTGLEEVYGLNGWQTSGASAAPVNEITYTAGRMTKVTERTAGGTVIGSVTLTWIGGALTSVTESAGVTRTWTPRYTGGVLTSITHD